MSAILSLVLLGLLGTQAFAATPSCSAITLPPAVSEPCCTPSQVLFVMDDSASILAADITNAYEFIKQAHCLFKETSIQAGMITFNKDINLTIPLDNYNHAQWYAQVDTVSKAQSAFTPMAEAFWLAARVFNNSAASQVAKCRDYVNRVVIVITDGNPVQNMVASANVPGYDAFPAAFIGASGLTAAVPKRTSTYVEEIVPEQARILRDMNVRIITVGLKANANSDDANVETYFKGQIVPDRRCTKIAETYFGKTTVAAQNTWCTTTKGIAAANRVNSQCYKYRYPSTQTPPGGNPGGFYPNTPEANWHCVVRDPAFTPIATDEDHVVTLTENTVAQLMTLTSPLFCPESCLA